MLIVYTLDRSDISNPDSGWLHDRGWRGTGEVCSVAPQNNIISLKQTGSSGRDEARPSITRRMSAPAIAIKELFAKNLASLLQQMFDGVDDALFDMAENAPSNQQQNVFFESMREVRFKRVEIEKDFLASIQQDFVTLFDPGTGKCGEYLESGNDASETLSLMDEDAVEEMVAIDAMVAKYEKQLESQLAALDARIAAMAQFDVGQFKSQARLNPVSPRNLCNNFSAACRILSVDIKARIVLFKLFEKVVLGAIEAGYKQANEKLIRANILPDYRALKSRAAGRVATSPNGGNAHSAQEDGQISELNELLSYVPQYIPQTGILLSPGGAIGAASHLTGSESGYRDIATALQMLSASRSPLVDTDALVQLLTAMQQRDATSQESEGGGKVHYLSPDFKKPEDVLASLADSLASNTSQGEPSIGRRERDVIGLVSMLFQFMLEDRVVSAPMKSAISRLQVPIIKVALKEPNFFCSPTHPARRLLNEMTQATVGWVETKDYHKDPLYQAICAAVERIINEYQEDQQVFLDVMADLKLLLDDEHKRAELRKKRLVDAEAGRDESARARDQIKNMLDVRLKPAIPEFIQQMIKAIWGNILFLAYLQQGEQSAEWKNALDTLDDLLWTVSPERYKDDRAEILRKLPDLLKSLRQGFESVNYDKSSASTFFAELEKTHMQIMQRAEPQPVLAVVAESDSDKLVAPKCDTAADDAPGAEQLKAANALNVGQWVELHENGGKKRCRLVAILRNSGKRIFVNRSGAKAAEYSVQEIAELLSNERLVLLEDAQLFDKALSSIIGGLRKQQREASCA